MYVNIMHCLYLLSFDPARLARGRMDYPRCLSVGSVGNRPTSSVPGRVKYGCCLRLTAVLGPRNSLMPGLQASSLIGEHIYYALVGVFPSAMDRDILPFLCTS